MFSRLRGGITLGYHTIKDKMTVAYVALAARIVLGVALVTNRSGSAAFTGDKFSGRVLNVEDGAATVLGRVLSSSNLISTVVVYTTTRFHNILHGHKRNHGKTLAPNRRNIRQTRFAASQSINIDDDTNCPLLDDVDTDIKVNTANLPHKTHLLHVSTTSPVIYDSAPPSVETPSPSTGDDPSSDDSTSDEHQNRKVVASCCYPGTETNSWSWGYFLAQMTAGFYCIGSGASAILNIESLIRLLETWIVFDYVSKCGDSQSSSPEIIGVDIATLILISANLYSFYTYNSPLLREYFRDLFLEKRLFKANNKLFAKYEIDRNNPESTLPIQLRITGNAGDTLYSTDGKLYKDNNGKIERINYYKGELKAANTEESLSLHNGFWEIDVINKIAVLCGISLGSLIIFYSNQHLNKVVIESVICHIIAIDEQLTSTDTFKFYSKMAALSSATANFFVNGQMTLGAVFNKQERARKEEEYLYLTDPNYRPVVEDQSYRQNLCLYITYKLIQRIKNIKLPTLDEPLEFGTLLKRILEICVWLDGFSTAQSTFTAVTDLPSTILDRDDLTYHPGIISAAIFLSLVAAKNGMDLDIEGIFRESERRRIVREKRKSKEEEQEDKTELSEVTTSSSGRSLLREPLSNSSPSSTSHIFGTLRQLEESKSSYRDDPRFQLAMTIDITNIDDDLICDINSELNSPIDDVELVTHNSHSEASTPRLSLGRTHS